MDKDKTVSILRKLQSNKQAAQQFVRDPAAEWQALGGQLPKGVTPARFSQNMRSSPLFKEIQAVANGQMSSSAGWSPCVTFMFGVFGALGITSAALAAASAPAIAAILLADVTAVQTLIAAAGGVGLYQLAVHMCHGL